MRVEVGKLSRVQCTGGLKNARASECPEEGCAHLFALQPPVLDRVLAGVRSFQRSIVAAVFLTGGSQDHASRLVCAYGPGISILSMACTPVGSAMLTGMRWTRAAGTRGSKPFDPMAEDAAPPLHMMQPFCLYVLLALRHSWWTGVRAFHACWMRFFSWRSGCATFVHSYDGGLSFWLCGSRTTVLSSSSSCLSFLFFSFCFSRGTIACGSRRGGQVIGFEPGGSCKFSGSPVARVRDKVAATWVVIWWACISAFRDAHAEATAHRKFCRLH